MKFKNKRSDKKDNKQTVRAADEKAGIIVEDFEFDPEEENITDEGTSKEALSDIDADEGSDPDTNSDLDPEKPEDNEDSEKSEDDEDTESSDELISEEENGGREKAGFFDKVSNILLAVCGAAGKFCALIKKTALKIASFYKKRTIPILICALCILIVALVFVLLLGAGQAKDSETKYQKWMRQLRTKDIAVCQIETINDFFDEYYYALSEGDTTALEAMYDDPQNANITTELAQIVESYSDITVYATPGINSGEVLAFVSYNINFVNIESAAPAVDSFYIMMDSEINSIYILTGMYTDSDINTFMYLASYREPVRSLLADAEEGLNSILESDSELRNIYIIMNAMADDEDDEEEETYQSETESEGSGAADEDESSGEEETD